MATLHPPPLVSRGGPFPLSASSRTEVRPVLKMSKDWVIPARAKPGRKPAQVEPESSRKAVNRASQRAFRERRQEYVAELEEKVRELEQGEGEKSVFFQQQALKAKEESAALQRENDGLRRLVTELRSELDAFRGGSVLAAGRSTRTLVRAKREGSVAAAVPDASGPVTKRPRRASARSTTKGPDYQDSISPSSSAGSPPSVAPTELVQPDEQAALSPQGLGDPCCGMCTSDSSCFCTDVGFKIDPSSKQSLSKHATTALMAAATAAAEPTVEPSQVAVPLRLRKTGKASVWAVHSSDADASTSTAVASSSSSKPALCNGDPSNCPACQDDPFGQAFCNALSESTCANNPCSNCPSSVHNPTNSAVTAPLDVEEDDLGLYESLADLPCCGDPSMCGSLSCGPRVKLEDDEMLPRSVPSGVKTVETIPSNEAWKILQGHPHIAFADLQMLADVVAKRTHCDGPVLASSSSVPLGPPPFGLGDADSNFRVPRLASHDSLVCAAEAGQRKRITVERGAVNEALAILDTSFGRGGPPRT